jgi:hypothetical protein
MPGEHVHAGLIMPLRDKYSARRRDVLLEAEDHGMGGSTMQRHACHGRLARLARASLPVPALDSWQPAGIDIR